MFQAANNTALIAGARADQRGTASGLLNLSRHLGLIMGAFAMGAVFARRGMRVTFFLAAGIVIASLIVITRAAIAIHPVRPAQ